MSKDVDTQAPVVRVCIVDDHESVRLGLAAACREAGFDVVAAAPTVRDAVAAMSAGTCDVLVLDLHLGDGSTVTNNVKTAQALGAAVLVHSIAEQVSSVREAIAAGVAGVIAKSASMKEVVDAVALAAKGEVIRNREWASAIEADVGFARVALGRRERDVLHLYASGLPLKVVAVELGITYGTAKEYLDRVRLKYMEVGRPAPTKVDLLRRAVEDGILTGLEGDDAAH